MATGTPVEILDLYAYDRCIPQLGPDLQELIMGHIRSGNFRQTFKLMVIEQRREDRTFQLSLGEDWVVPSQATEFSVVTIAPEIDKDCIVPSQIRSDDQEAVRRCLLVPDAFIGPAARDGKYYPYGFSVWAPPKVRTS